MLFQLCSYGFTWPINIGAILLWSSYFLALCGRQNGAQPAAHHDGDGSSKLLLVLDNFPQRWECDSKCFSSYGRATVVSVSQVLMSNHLAVLEWCLELQRPPSFYRFKCSIHIPNTSRNSLSMRLCYKLLMADCTSEIEFRYNCAYRDRGTLQIKL